MTSNILAAISRATYIHHIIVGKMIIKHQGVLPLLGKLLKDTPAASNLRITHIDELSLYITSDEDILLMNQAAHALVKNDHKPAAFHANSFA